jgi:protein disulfide-isomerase A6
LKPIYEQVAGAFAQEKHCLVTAVDATASKDIAERYKVTGYPTIKFLKADSDEVVPYEGPRTLEAFVDFLNKECGTFRNSDGTLTEEVQ